MGYREIPDSPQGSEWEPTDALAGRVRGFCLLLGAVLQSDSSPQELGLPAAWSLLARSDK